jgi:hypothetical protein
MVWGTRREHPVTLVLLLHFSVLSSVIFFLTCSWAGSGLGWADLGFRPKMVQTKWLYYR